MVFAFPLLGISGTLDIVFAVDGSNTVDTATFDKIKKFIMAALKTYTISPKDTHVGLFSFGGIASEASLSLQGGISKLVIEQGINSLKKVGGSRMINEAISYADKEMFTARAGARPKASKVLVLLITGKSDLNGKNKLPDVARKLKEKGVEVFVIVIGKDADTNEVNAIASNPESIAQVDDSDNLPSALGTLEKASGEALGKQ